MKGNLSKWIDRHLQKEKTKLSIQYNLSETSEAKDRKITHLFMINLILIEYKVKDKVKQKVKLILSLYA